MLHTLTIKGGFAHRDTTIEFGSGLTAITGPNGSGKSEILDMIRFALFGAPALRTVASDYKNHRVSLEWSVRGCRYRVERSISNAKLTREGDILATGTRPVNDRIRAIFGYDLTVFDTAHAVTQDALLELLSARPADRKKLIDQTLGLDTLNKLIDQCKTEAVTLLPQIELLERLAVPPVAPVAPPGYRPSSSLTLRRDRIREATRLRQAVTKALAELPPLGAEPVWEHEWTLEEVEAHQASRRALEGQIKALRPLLRPLPTLSLEEVAEEERRLESARARMELEKLTKQPPFTLDQLQEMEAQLEVHDRWKEWKKLAQAGTHKCPACAHEWFVRGDEMERYGNWRGQPEPPLPAIQSLLMIHKTMKEWDWWDKEKEKREALEKIAHLPAPTHSQEQLEAIKLAHANAGVRTQIAELENLLSTMPDRKEDIALWHRHVQARLAWEKARKLHELRPRRLRQLARVLPSPDIDEEFAAAHRYEAELRAWEGAQAKYEDSIRMLEELRVRHQEWRGAVSALDSIRRRVKSHLAPSLSRAASNLLTRMTSGALNTLLVTEDFEVTVDGLVIEGLSGAGKAAANLALRIALGYVLTNRVFSVLLADEVDAGMDAERAEATERAFRTLTTSLKQVVLVTHKSPNADHYLRL